MQLKHFSFKGNSYQKKFAVWLFLEKHKFFKDGGSGENLGVVVGKVLDLQLVLISTCRHSSTDSV